MNEIAVAETQYNDLKGTTAFDGHEGPPLHELAKRTDMPSEYFPIGFELWHLDPNDSGEIRFQLLAVKKSESGETMDDISSFAKSHELQAYRFDGSIPLFEFPVLFKRIDIKAIRKALRADNISISRPEGYV